MAVDIRPQAPPRRPRLLSLGLVFLTVGTSSAVVMPFLSLFLSTEVHADPLRVTVFLVVAPLAGVTVATLVGRLSDRRPIRRRLLIGAALAGAAGCGVTAFVRDYWILLALAATATALATTLFPQSFAYARQLLERDRSDRAAMGISTLRTVFSLAWVAGPPLSAFLLHTGGFRLVYGTAALMYAVAALVVTGRLAEVTAPPVTAPDDSAPGGGEVSRWTLALTVAAFTLLQCPLTLGVQALPLLIGRELGGDPSDAGVVLGLCAALEIPLMLGLGALTTRVRLRALVLLGAACGAAYYTLAAWAPHVWVLGLAQVGNAFFIAAVSGLGISYVQELLPGRPGRATTLFTNTFPIGAMLAGPLLGLSARLGYRLAYGTGAVLCAAGLVVLLVARPRR
ncbi:sugar efflux transporter [Micromonospora auratinigra]|uniref:MFS transporter, SET family, sugar efflux transporter n=1 Tax=Micromonospora auratinigra TaxID=261654 RepID=A0A1A8ZHJ2_9ACTN|nr:sugar efflux transporter [Micromonospora auratinigra]SBT43298.1 MFS transporter, SET family, sugar efflux transporter [Micromonospora auratinigra]